MAESADVVSSVVEVVRVTPERSIIAQILTVLLTVNCLPHGVDRLQDLSFHLFRFDI